MMQVKWACDSLRTGQDVDLTAKGIEIARIQVGVAGGVTLAVWRLCADEAVNIVLLRHHKKCGGRVYALIFIRL